MGVQRDSALRKVKAAETKASTAAHLATKAAARSKQARKQLIAAEITYGMRPPVRQMEAVRSFLRLGEAVPRGHGIKDPVFADDLSPSVLDSSPEVGASALVWRGGAMRVDT